ncbi:MAG: hypothetical protein EOM37_19160 [Proteobacteria bacterium]|nr:hypothetical protein [Pseudomonadota bacterium]
MFKIGPKTRKGAGSSMPELSADDPIYTRGFAVGEMRSRPSSSDTAATTSPESRKESPSSSPPDDLEVQAFQDYEQALSRSISDMEQRRKGQAQSSESTTPESSDAGPTEK